MLLDLLRAVTDFIVLVTRLTTEELTDEQRMALIDQFIQLDGLEAACQSSSCAFLIDLSSEVM